MDEEMAVDQTTDSLDALSSVLTKLTENPYDIAVHAEHARVAQETSLEDQVEQALEMYTGFWAAGDYAWLPLIEHKIAGSNLESPEDLQGILDLFSRAEQDYLCECCAVVVWMSS